VQKDISYKVLLNVCYIALQIDYKEGGKIETLNEMGVECSAYGLDRRIKGFGGET